MNQTSFNGPTPQSAAAKNGLWIGLMWLISFLCVINGINTPLLMIFGHFIGLYSLVVLTRMLYKYRSEVYNLSWLSSLGYVYLICIYAALITTMSQYIYFTFWDDGQFINDLSILLSDPHYISSTQKMMPDFNPELVLESITKMSTRDMLVQFSFTNLCIATFCAIPISVIGSIKKVDKNSKNPSNVDF